MGLFRKKKVEEPLSVPEAEVKEKVPELNQKVAPKNKRKEIEHYILTQCEGVMEYTKELEECRGEYNIVTGYLEDINTIENLPEEEFKQLKEAAASVARLNGVRDDYRRAEKKLPDSKFMQMQQFEDEMPDEIKRFKANESYQATVKRDMQYIEGEKQELTLRHQELIDDQNNTQKILQILLGISGLSFVLMFILHTSFNIDCQNMLMLVVFLVALATFGIFMKRQFNETELRRTEVNMNHAINLENKLKIKYVNVTNAVDYTCEKYHVKNSYELNYQWEQYMDMVKEKQKYMKTSEELEYYNNKLVKLLRPYRLYDDKIWISQVEGLIDEREMVEIKHDLFSRRKKLRDRLDYNMSLIKKAHREVDYLAANMKKCSPNILEIVYTVDHLCQELEAVK